MAKVETLQALLAFANADIDYMKLIRKAMESRDGTGRVITISEWRQIAAARKRRDQLEREVYAFLRNHHEAP